MKKTYSVLQLGNSNGDPTLLRNLAEGIVGSDAATVSQLKNAAWTIGTVSGTTPSTTVNNGDVVNFANGTGTTANITVSTAADGKDTYSVVFNVVKGNITSNESTGIATGETGDNFATTTTVATAINQAVSKSTQQYQADNQTEGENPVAVTITRQPSQALALKGGATGTLTDNNIGTVADATNGIIAIKLAKELKDLGSATYTAKSGDKEYSTKIDASGITVTPVPVDDVDTATKTVTLTDKGLFNGNNNITGLTSPLTGLSTEADKTYKHVAYEGLSPEFLSTLRDLGVNGDNKTQTQLKAEKAQLASAATVGDLQNLSNMPIYFSADNYHDSLEDGNVLAKKLGEQLSIETGKFNMVVHSQTDNTYNFETYNASSSNSYNDENMAAVVHDGSILLGFRNTPIFTGVRIGTIDDNGTEKSITITNTTANTTNATPTLKIGGNTPVQITNIATPTATSDGSVAVNKTYVDAMKVSVTGDEAGKGAAKVTPVTNSDTSTTYNVHVDKWLSFVGDSNQELVQAPDGKYYTTTALNGLVYDKANQKWTNAQGGSVTQPTPTTTAFAKLTSAVAGQSPVLSNVGKGTIASASTDAINGSQLQQLVSKLGLTVNDNKTDIEGSFNPINNGGDTSTTPTNVLTAINQLTVAVNKGRVYAGDDYVAASGAGADYKPEKNAIKRELGERINIKGGADSTTLANLSDGNIGVVSNSGNGADTLTVKLAKNIKGISDITFGQEATTGTTADTTIVDKSGVTITTGTTVTKFTDKGILAGGQAIENVKDAISPDAVIETKALELYKKDHTDFTGTTFASIPQADQATYKTNATTELNKDSVAYNKAVVGNMLTASGDVLKQATTLYDLQRVANAGLDFVGNNSGTVVHRPLSSTLNIIGEGDYSAITADKPFQSTAGNIYIQGFNTTTDGFKLVAKLAKDLQNLNSATFSTIENDKTYTTVVNGKGNTITTTEGNNQTVATSTSTGTTYETLQTITNDGNTSVVPNAPKVEVTNKGITITKLKKDGSGNTTGYDTNNTVSLTENGLNNGGNKISNVAEGSADNDVATVAQLKAGTAAATTKVTGSGAATVTSTTASDESTTYNVHVEKVLSYTDASGNELVQAADGKYYTATDINGLVYDGTTWKKADGTELSEEEKPVAQTATTAKLADVTSDKAPILSNINDGAITANSTDAINGSQLYSLEKDVLGFKEGTGNDAGKLVSPTFTAVTAGGTDTTANTTAPTTIVGAIEQLTSAANKGRVYAGDGLVKDTSDTADRQNAFTRQLGETLNIKGGVTDPAKLSDGNIGVVSNGVDTLTVKLAKTLKDLTSAQFVKEDSAGNKYTTTTSGDGTTVVQNNKDGSSATTSVTSGGTTIEQISQDGNKTTATSNSQGTTYETLTKADQGGTTVYQPNGPKTTVTNGGITITPVKDGNYDTDNAVSLTENGLNNGGNVITGIKSAVESTKVQAPAGTPANNTDPDGNLINPTFAQRLEAAAAGDTADSAVNVKDLYQVSQNATTAAAAAKTVVKGAGAAVVSKATGAQGQDIYEVKVEQPVTYVDAQGSKLVKGADGKWHKEDDLKGMAYVPGATPGSGVWMKVDENGALVAVPAEQAPQEATPAAMKLVNADGKTTTATTLGNVASAIGGNSSDGSFITNLNKVGTTDEGAIDGNTAVTTQDLKNLANAGFKLQTNSGSAQTIQLGDTIQVVDGANTKVSAITSANGVHTYSINVDGLPMAFKDATGNTLVKVGGKFYKASDIGSDGKLASDAAEATPTAVTLLDSTGKEPANGQKLAGIQSSVKDVNVPQLDEAGQPKTDAEGKPIYVENPTFAEQLATAVADNTRKNAAVNVSDLNEVSKAAANAQATADKGFNVKTSATGDGVVSNGNIAATGDNIKPGDNLEFVAGHNIAITQDKGKITIAANTQSIVNDSQLPTVYTITDDKGQTVKVYKVGDKFSYDVAGAKPVADADVSKIMASVQGADGDVNKAAKLGNVADGAVVEGSKEAINGGQLAGLKSALEQYFGTDITNTTVVNNDSTTVNQINPVKVENYTVVREIAGKKTLETVRVPLDEKGKPYLKTYNVADQGEYITNNLYTAVRNISEQGIKYFHTNDGQAAEEQAGNTEDSSAAGKYSTAIGYKASVESDANNAIAMGSNATVIKGSENAIAIGKGGTVAGKNTISIGTGNTVAGEGSGAIGDPSIVNAKSSYSVGNDNQIGDTSQIEKLQNLIKQRDELALNRPKSPDLPVAPKEPDPGASEAEKEAFDKALEKYKAELAERQPELNAYLAAVADYKKKRDEITQQIMDVVNNISTQDVMALGNNIKVGAKASNAVAVGTKVTIEAGASHAVAVGTSATVKATNGVAIGNSASVEAENGVALGANATSTAKNAVAIGNSSTASADNGVALGNKAKVTTKNSVAIGAGAEATQTLEQLQKAKPFGIEGNPYIVGYGEQVVGEVSVGRTSEDGQQEVRRITNVAAGSAPTDAVNVSQLYGLGAQVNKQVTQINNRIDGLSKDIDASTATAAAMANLPQAYMPGKSMVAMGTGFHRSQQAIAIGLSRISDNGKLIIKGSVSHSTRNNTAVGAGIGYQW